MWALYSFNSFRFFLCCLRLISRLMIQTVWFINLFCNFSSFKIWARVFIFQRVDFFLQFRGNLSWFCLLCNQLLGRQLLCVLKELDIVVGTVPGHDEEPAEHKSCMCPNWVPSYQCEHVRNQKECEVIWYENYWCPLRSGLLQNLCRPLNMLLKMGI